MTAEARLRDKLSDAAKELGADGVEVQLDRPRNPEHGDWATNLAMVLAGRLKRPPRQVAEDILERLDLSGAGVESAEVAGPGFINFRLSGAQLETQLASVLAGDAEYGRAASTEGPVMVEFVSANPTGPLHIGHGRQAALGDAIASLLASRGRRVHREFYYNDSGRQMELLARSVWARYQQALGEEAEFPDEGYHGEYIQEIAEGFASEFGDRFRGDGSPEALDAVRAYAVDVLRAEQDRDLAAFGVRFDEYFLESSLYETGRVEDTAAALRETGLVYEREGAVWLRTTEYGDQKDRVMIRGDGLPTYFLPDVAYHMTKWERGYRHAINVQGADHHGTMARVRAGLQALGLPEGYPEYVLHQMVRLERGGREVKFSKRAGSYTTLRELVDETGPDVARYFFLMRRGETQMVFDLDLALDHSEKNPVYKVQYAHARVMSIFRKAGVDPDTAGQKADLGRLRTGDEQDLIKQLGRYPEVLARAADGRAPHLVCDYLEETAGLANSWYHSGNPSRNPELAVLVEDPELREARLALARGVRIVLRNGLQVLGVSAPDRMEREDDG
ncbi:MAG: arginine--tRNA ligase [Gemmatimonadota bacterium]